MKVCAIVFAAGQGSRMKAKVNKQFLELREKPVLYYALNKLNNNKYIDEIILVASKKEVQYCKENIVKKFNFNKVKSVVEGGSERKDSVLNGLKKVSDADIVLIHDGARPFLTDKLIEDGIKYTTQYGAAACGVMPIDTIKLKRDDNFSSKKNLDRQELIAIQTPQVFKYDMIRECHEKLQNSDVNITDDTMVVEYFGHNVYLYEGDYTNIKITRPMDLTIGNEILNDYLQRI